MIYQLKLQIKQSKPPVWRRVQLDSQTSLADVHSVIATSFLLEEKASYTFSIDNTSLDSNASLDSVLKEEKDQAVYESEADSEASYIVQLEKAVEADPKKTYPLCIKVTKPLVQHGEDFNETQEKHRLNEAFASLQQQESSSSHDKSITVPGIPASEQASASEWKTLFEKAKTFYHQAPWERIEDQEIFIVRDEQTDETAYCSILKGNTSVHGIAVYHGEEGKDALYSLLHGNNYQALHQKCIILTFDSREDLETEDARIIDESGAAFGEGQEWPVIRSMLPGYYPWFLTSAETIFMTKVLEQAAVVDEHVRNDSSFLEETPKKQRRARLYTNGAWMDTELPFTSSDEPLRYTGGLKVDQWTMTRLQQQPQIKTKLALGVFTLPNALQSEEEERPLLVESSIWFNAANEKMIDHKEFPFLKRAAYLQNKLVNIIFNHLKGRPSQILAADPEICDILMPVAKQIGVEVYLTSKLPPMEKLMKQMAKSK